MKVGFIGLGKMGAGICSNIVKNGIDVVVYDINPGQRAEVRGHGCLFRRHREGTGRPG